MQGAAACVLLYGGHLVYAGAMSGGDLISFMLYQQALAGSFQSIGDVFTSLTAAVGAAEKVLEMLHRQPKEALPGTLQVCKRSLFANQLRAQSEHSTRIEVHAAT